MKGLDTNILVRYLTEDDPRQAAAAVKEIEGTGKKDEKLIVQLLVLCELAWVLESAYGVGKKELLDVFERILRTAQFEIPGKDLVWRSLADYRAGRGDFSDHLLGRMNEDEGASVTVTFDKALRGTPRFHVLTAY